MTEQQVRAQYRPPRGTEGGQHICIDAQDEDKHVQRPLLDASWRAHRGERGELEAQPAMSLRECAPALVRQSFGGPDTRCDRCGCPSERGGKLPLHATRISFVNHRLDLRSGVGTDAVYIE